MVTSLGLCLIYCYLLWLPYASFLLQSGAYSEVPKQYGFSVFELSPWKYWGHALLVIGCLSGVALVFRRYVRIFLCIHLMIFSGLIVSVPFSLSADHKIACVLMLWLLLLPTGFDARGYYTGLAVFGLRFQLGLIYFCGTLYKLFDPSWVTGNALLVGLLNMVSASSLGLAFGLHVPPYIHGILTYLSLAVEMLALPLILIPVGSSWIRRALFCTLGLFHLGTFFLFDLGMFPFIMITYLFSLLETDDFRIFQRKT